MRTRKLLSFFPACSPGATPCQSYRKREKKVKAREKAKAKVKEKERAKQKRSPTLTRNRKRKELRRMIPSKRSPKSSSSKRVIII